MNYQEEILTFSIYTIESKHRSETDEPDRTHTQIAFGARDLRHQSGRGRSGHCRAQNGDCAREYVVEDAESSSLLSSYFTPTKDAAVLAVILQQIARSNGVVYSKLIDFSSSSHPR